MFRANRTVKVNSIGLSAFNSPNYPPLATLGAFIDVNRELTLPPPRGPFRVYKKLTSTVIVLKLAPGFDDESITAMIRHSTSLKAVVLEMYGTGIGPLNRGSDKGSLLSAIIEAKTKGIVVVAVSQCIQGGVSLDTYSMGREFKEAGVISGGDMTTEACVTKIAYLFGRYEDPNKVSELLTKSIRGELTTDDKKKSHSFFTKSSSETCL